MIATAAVVPPRIATARPVTVTLQLAVPAGGGGRGVPADRRAARRR